MASSSSKRSILLACVIALILFTANQCAEFLYLWINDAGTAELCVWDCGWYGSIAAGGYDLKPHGGPQGDTANWAFFPLFPLLAGYLFSTKLVSLNMALILTGKFFFLTGIFSFILFAREWEPELNPWVAGLVAAFSPYSIYGNVGYTESLFLTLTCFSFYFLKKNSFVAAGLSGAFLTGTKIVGGSFGFSYLIYAARRWRHYKKKERMLFGLCLIPAGLALYMLFLHFHMGDALAFSHIQVAWNHQVGNPLPHLRTVFGGHPIETAAGISILFFIPVTLWLLIKRQFEMLIFALMATLLPLCASLISMPRYIWWQAPVLFAVATAIRHKKWAVWLYLAAGIVTSYFVYTAWLRGDTWVV